MSELPPPLSLLGLDPKRTLKAMLEASDRKDRGDEYDTPLREVDPLALDELLNRIDSGALALNQVPDSKDIEKLVEIYWSMREKFAIEQQLGITSRPKKPKAVKAANSVMNYL